MIKLLEGKEISNVLFCIGMLQAIISMYKCKKVHDKDLIWTKFKLNLYNMYLEDMIPPGK